MPLTPLPVSTETSGKRMLKEERFWVVNSAQWYWSQLWLCALQMLNQIRWEEKFPASSQWTHFCWTKKYPLHYLGFLFFFLSNRGKTHKESIEDVDWFEIRKPQLVPVPDREREGKILSQMYKKHAPQTHTLLPSSLPPCFPSNFSKSLVVYKFAISAERSALMKGGC